MSGLVFLDFEFNGTAEPQLNLVCCATTVYYPDGSVEQIDWWLHKDDARKAELKEYLSLHVHHLFVAYSAEAEARSMMALGLNALAFNWVDLYLEYKMLSNHNHKLCHGMQLIDGKPKKTWPYGEKGKQNLAAACYKLLDVLIDTDHKTKMRDLIISAPEEFISEDARAIMAYCRSDVVYLPRLKAAIEKAVREYLPSRRLSTYFQEAKLRGENAARTARMVALGYPVNVEWLENFSGNVPLVLETAVRDINRQFPGAEPFRWNRPKQRFSLDQGAVKSWIRTAHNGQDWLLTDTGDISLALEAFEKYYDYSHDYPEGNLGAQMVRYLKLQQSVRGYNPHADKTIFDYLGSDGRVRPYLNAYGAQSSRFQPASTSFIFLKTAFQRVLVQPAKGRLIFDFDWSSQEFLISALLSGDSAMLAAYRSGDVYLAFGKMIGWIPQNGTKKTHQFERDVCKSLVLGLSYLMTKYGLARKLTTDTGKIFTEDQAQELVEQFEETFQVFSDWRKQVIADYKAEGYVQLADGWYMLGDNDNDRSVGNVKVQGTGAIIARKAVALMQDTGLDVLFPNHDAIYVEGNDADTHIPDVMKECMDKAFAYYFTGRMKEQAAMIRVDGNVWGPNAPEGEFVSAKGLRLTSSKLFIDPRGEKEYKIFSRYFEESSGAELLA